jgi:hypothetical protein
MYFWTGNNPQYNNAFMNYSTIQPQAIGKIYHGFTLRLTSQSTTRKRLLTQGSTTTITHDFETSQNLEIFLG